jgi:hypothetical protein
MLSLPPNFDYGLLMNEFFACAAPFVAIAVLFVAYRVVVKSFGHV